MMEPDNTAGINSIQLPPMKKDLVAILLSRMTRRAREFPGIGEGQEVNVSEANGSVASIIDWATAANLDRGPKACIQNYCRKFCSDFLP